MRQKIIGLLGGMSWESSAVYYRIINERLRAHLGGSSSAKCVLYSVDFAPIELLQRDDRWEEAAEILIAAGKALQAAGAEFLVLCTNTMHKVADHLVAGIDIPLLHLADITAAAVSATGLNRVGLIGTAYTMEHDFYLNRLHRHGLDILVPGATDRCTVNSIIFDELIVGVVSDKSRRAYRDVIVRLVNAGAEGLILGCTEIELLISASDSPVPVFPTARIHAEYAVDYALGLVELPPPPSIAPQSPL
jgi:aspartate racemase